MRRLARIAGTLMIVAGLGSIAWALAVWQWQDPFTALYTKYRQGKLASSYEQRVASYRLPEPAPAGVAPLAPARTKPSSLDEERARIALAARRYRKGLHEGDPIGRLRVPRLGLNAIFVNGTQSGTLKSGPGRHRDTFLPGEGELVYIAGHRTTYGAPFAEIDKLRHGDRVTIEVPYATFEYEITGHRIVKASELSVLRSRGREVIALQACHPRFFATHRWITYARPVRVVPRVGEPYSLRGDDALAAPAGLS